MKKILIYFIVVFIAVPAFSQRLKPFGTKVSQDKVWTVYEDKFEGKKCALQKYIGCTFSGPHSTINLYPYFIFTDKEKVAVPRINIQSTDIVGVAFNKSFNKSDYYSYSWASKIIFVGNGEKIILDLSKAKQDQDGKDITVDFALTEEQFKILMEILSAEDLICAVYSKDNTAEECKQYSKRQNTVAKNALAYFEANFADYQINNESEVALQ